MIEIVKVERDRYKTIAFKDIKIGEPFVFAGDCGNEQMLYLKTNGGLKCLLNGVSENGLPYNDRPCYLIDIKIEWDYREVPDD